MDALMMLSSVSTWIATAASALYFLYWYGTRNFDYFSKQGIPGPKPLPFVGNLWGSWKRNLPNYDRQLAKQYGRTFGTFDGTQPTLWTTDVALIKSIFVKDFDNFINRRDYSVKAKFVRKMMILIQNQEWRDVRSSIAPAFSAEKVQKISALVRECADQLVVKLQKIAETEGKLDVKMHFSAFTIDVIARSAFGMTIDNLGEKDDPFVAKAKDVFNTPVHKSSMVLLPYVFPSLMSMFGERYFLSEGFQFFINVLKDLIERRDRSAENYHDFIEMAGQSIAMCTKEVDGKQMPMWNKEEINEIVIAQSIMFLVAGFDTTATTLTHSIFLLARNEDIQQKLYLEITKKSELDEQVDLPFLDYVINEVLRMYPPVTKVERQCNKDVTYSGLIIKKGVNVSVSPFALHYDEQYYPDPNCFKPDRWSPDSPIRSDPCAFMPFGMGPRNCIGIQFAIQEIKIALCSVIKRFRFFPIAETPKEIQIEDGFLAVIKSTDAVIGIEIRQ